MPDNRTAPEVSIVIPTRNRWDELSRLGLKAALLQQDVSFEVLVVDDCSSQSPPRSLPGFRDRRVRYLQQKKWAGQAAARNRGIAEARGEWIAFLDDDDMWAPQKIATVLAAANAADADFAYSAVVVLDQSWRPIEIADPISPGDLREFLRVACLPAGASSVIAKSSLIGRAGGFDTAFEPLSDWDMWVRLASTGQAAASGEVLVAYREGSRVLDDELRHREDWERMAAKHKGVAVDRAVYDRWAADIFCRSGHRRAAARHYLRSARARRDPKPLALAVAALFGRDAVELLRRVRSIQPPEWLALYEAAIN